MSTELVIPPPALAHGAEQPLQISHVLGALSYALDLTEGQPPGHSIRCCWIGIHIGQALGLSDSEQHDLYYALLLKDAGCSSNAARLCELYGSDDRTVKRGFKVVDSDSTAQLLHFVVTHAGLNQGLAMRLRRLLTVARDGSKATDEMIQTRCERGASISRQLGFNERVASAIHSLDEHWNGRGRPDQLQGESIPLGARVALLAQVVDVFHVVGGREAALKEVQKRSGSWFDPQLVAVLQRAGADESFWNGLAAANVEQRVQALSPAAQAIPATEAQLDAIAEAFGQVIDAKSPYTAGHSSRVSAYVEAVARDLGLSSERCRWLRRGALLHDLGKLGVSNAILDKPGKLTEPEWEEMRRHAEYSEQILERIVPFRRLANVAAAHHERLDGKGYPRGIDARAITLETRIITVADIFDAITAERPYRAAVPIPETLEIMAGMVGTAIDADVFEALGRVCDRGL